MQLRSWLVAPVSVCLLVGATTPVLAASPIQSLAPPALPATPDAPIIKELVAGSGPEATLGSVAAVRLTFLVLPPQSGIPASDPHINPQVQKIDDGRLHAYELARRDDHMLARYIADAIVGMKVGGKRTLTAVPISTLRPPVYDIELVDVAPTLAEMQSRHTVSVAVFPSNSIDPRKMTPTHQPPTVLPGGAQAPGPGVPLSSVDVLGLRLGMGEAEARSVVAAHSPHLRLVPVFFTAYSMLNDSPDDLDRDRSQLLLAEGARRSQLEARKKFLDHTAAEGDLPLLAAPIRMGLQSAATQPAQQIGPATLLQDDQKWAQLLDAARSGSELVEIATGGEGDGTVIDVHYSIGFAEDAHRPSVQTLVKALNQRYGAPSYTTIENGSMARGSPILVWLFDAQGMHRPGVGVETKRTELPLVFHGSRALSKPRRLQVEIYTQGNLFASGVSFRLFDEQQAADAFGAKLAQANAEVAALRKQVAAQSPELFAESLKGPPLLRVDPNPAERDASLYAITLGKPLPRFADWSSSDSDQALSPMQVTDAVPRRTAWGHDELEVQPTDKAYREVPDIGAARVELQGGVVQGLRFGRISTDASTRVLAYLERRYGKAQKTGDGQYLWSNERRVIRYVPYDQLETHALVAAFASTVSMLFGGDAVDPPAARRYGTLVLYTPEAFRRVEAWKAQHPAPEG